MAEKTLPETVAERLAELRLIPFDVLAQMPPSSSSESLIGKRTVTSTTWLDVVDGGVLRVVVQAYDRGGGLMGRMSADGFRINGKSEITPLLPAEIYEFL